jgi:hypothetical protein
MKNFARKHLGPLFAFACLLSAACAMGGCVSNPLNTSKGDYYALDAKVTGVDAGVLKFINDCKLSAAAADVCTSANLQRLAQATTALGTAMDGYSAAVRDPGTAAGGLAGAAAIVDAALLTVTTLLAEFGVSTP